MADHLKTIRAALEALNCASSTVEAQRKRWEALAVIDALEAAMLEPVNWPVMPPSKGQSPVLFEDGYAEGWAKCISECKKLFAAPPAQQAQPSQIAEGGVCEALECCKQAQAEAVPQDGWKLSSDGLPPIGADVIGGHFYQDTWLKGEPVVFGWGRCSVIAESHKDFKDGKRWLTFGPSHNQITHWRYPPAAPQPKGEQT